jgi:hypothetical protein
MTASGSPEIRSLKLEMSINKDNSTSPHAAIHKNSLDQIAPKKKGSKSVNDKKKFKDVQTRKELWMNKCGAKKLMDANPGYYQSLKNNFLQYPSPWFDQINIDLKRTLANDKLLKTPEKEEQMRDILYWYVKRNPALGYCQGMNFITALLIQHLNEEETFWVLCQMLEYMLPIDYYTTMNGVIVDQRWLEFYIKDKFSSIAKHFRKVEFDAQPIIFQWFVCLFSNSLPFDIVTNIWDQFFTRGIIAIFEYSLAILEVMKKKILGTKDIGALFMMLRSLPEYINDWKVLSNSAK